MRGAASETGTARARSMMNRFLSLVFALGLGVIAAAPAFSLSERVVPYRRLAGRPLELLLTFPRDWSAGDSRPVAVVFPGGGWVDGGLEFSRPHAAYLARRGLVVARVQLRGPAKGEAGPVVQVKDGRSAVRWIRAHAAEIGADPSRLVVVGSSSGGHVAASTALHDGVDAASDDLSISTVPQALVLFNPVLNLERPEFEKTTQGDAALARRLSPTAHLAQDSPPALILVGSEDPFMEQAEEFWSEARRLGFRADRYVAEGGRHGFHNESPDFERAMVAVDGFLASLGFVDGPAPMRVLDSGVIEHASGVAWDSVNLWTSAAAPRAFLMDARGVVLHTWGAPEARAPATASPGWGGAHLLPDGGLIVSREGAFVSRIDADSQPVWSFEADVHGDLVVREDGSVVLLARAWRSNPLFDKRRRVAVDEIVTLDANGRERDRLLLFDALAKGGQVEALYELRKRYRGRLYLESQPCRAVPTSDALVGYGLALPGPLADRLDLLLSVPGLDAVLGLRLGRRKVVDVDAPKGLCHPTSLSVLPGGGVLLFSNPGKGQEPTLVELAPNSAKIARTYAFESGGPLSSLCCPSAQRLANGNTLIVEGPAGRALEIAEDGTSVWEFHAPGREGIGSFRKLAPDAAAWLQP